LGIIILTAVLQMAKKDETDNRIRVRKGSVVKLSAIRRFSGLSSLSEAADEAITVYSDNLAGRSRLYAETLAEEVERAGLALLPVLESLDLDGPLAEEARGAEPGSGGQ
jgi:hypothetical protein